MDLNLIELQEKLFDTLPENSIGQEEIPAKRLDRGGRHENQGMLLNRKIVKIDVKGGRTALHPEDLIKIVPVRPLPILAKPKPFLKGADVEFLPGSSGIVGK